MLECGHPVTASSMTQVLVPGNFRMVTNTVTLTGNQRRS